MDQSIINEINNMTRHEMCKLWRYAPAGSIYFDKSKPYFEVFNKRFIELGRFTPEISKSL